MKRNILKVGLIIIILYCLFVLFSQKLLVVKASCESQYGPCPVEIQTAVNSIVNKPYFAAIDTLNKELEDNSRVGSWKHRFGPSGDLVVIVEQNKAEVAVKHVTGEVYLYDKNANVVGQSENTQLPLISFMVESIPGDKLPFMVLLFRDLFRYYDIQSADGDEHGLYVKLKENITVVFPLEGDIDLMFGKMELIVARLNTALRDNTIDVGASRSYEIDLRYKNPVIRFSQSN